MKTPSGGAVFQSEVKRSRFIAEIEGVSTREAAESVIRTRREEHPDAAHVVYAFSIGDEKSRLFGMSDDGEPKGTAGRPVLEVLKGSDVTDCVLTVVRYFGGTKLGTGGLVHAYGDAAKGVLQNLPTTEKRDLLAFSLRVPYELHQPVRSLLDQFGCTDVEESFAEEVTLRASVDRIHAESLQGELRNVSRGTIEIAWE
jgi:uncharacterized YigZ family protein